MTEAELVLFDDTAPAWERAFYAFLAEKERRSGSRRTVDAYSSTLQRFFGRLGKPPDQVTSQDVFGFAYGRGPSGREPKPITTGARLACISSFFRFLIRMKIVSSNPCDEIERPRANPTPPRGLSTDEIRRLLAVIPETPEGLRDRAIVLTLVLTGRRRSEILNLKVGDLSMGGELFYTYRGKGGKRAKRELPRPAYEAIERALTAWGKSLASMKPEGSLWPSPRAVENGAGITSATFYARFRRYMEKAGLAPAGVHILRHAAAKLRREAGESVETVSAFLDHSSLQVTSVYLRRLEGQEDRGWGRVAEALGV
jgi:site-specific recombinase XerD